MKQKNYFVQLITFARALLLCSTKFSGWLVCSFTIQFHFEKINMKINKKESNRIVLGGVVALCQCVLLPQHALRHCNFKRNLMFFFRFLSSPNKSKTRLKYEPIGFKVGLRCLCFSANEFRKIALECPDRHIPSLLSWLEKRISEVA